MSSKAAKAARKLAAAEFKTATVAEVPEKKKKLAKRMKLAGAALLLTAFGMQMRQNQQTGLEAERLTAAQVDARAHIKALGYENLYYSVKNAGKDEPEYLHLAAYNYYVGRKIMMETSPGDKDKTESDLDAFKRQADAVHDVASFQQFIGADNDLTSNMSATVESGFTDTYNAASRFGACYLVLYAIGSLLALIGQALE